ncbi:MAG TPA: single-stranded-DNA-specific exonuclease RecJ [Candidatus Paceibacterota bacterium]|nr:single-stranded-DNA-specific exonuclease RecJ [Candidatus Paceibacterota bacterium]
MQKALSPLLRSLLEKRGVTTEADIAAFLNPDYDLHTHDPFLLAGMREAVARVYAAMERNERIAIYADFDCDGIPGAALLSDLFKKLGYSNFEVYIPHRDREGYGLHTDALAGLAQRGVSLVITVDVGTNASESIAYATEKGIDVIVTDHHEVTHTLPACVAVLNPKIAPYPYPSLCGAGVAYKLAQALLSEGRARAIGGAASIPLGWEKWLLDLVAIATVADMVPLTGENRTLVFWGLQVLRKSQRPGITALCSQLRLRKAELTEDDIGFSIAPRINAASRMDSPQLALALLTTQDMYEAQEVAAKLETLNNSRKGVVAGYVREAKKHARTRFAKEEAVVVIGNPEWKPSLLGLAANSIVEERGGVACLWGRDGNGRIKGSCRSDGSFSVVELFTKAAEEFEEFGGHERSGGFTLVSERVHEFPNALATAARGIERVAIDRSRPSDAIVTIAELSTPLLRELSQLAPFGLGNPKPVLRISGARVTDIRRFGKEKNHIECMLVCSRTGSTMRSFDFFRSPEHFSHTPVAGQEVAPLATLERDTYRGGLALRLVDVLPA